MAVTSTFTIFMEHVFRAVEQAAKPEEDYHSLYASTRIMRVVVGSTPKGWTFLLKDAVGGAVGASGDTATFRMKQVVRNFGSTTIDKVSKALTYNAPGTYKLSLEAADTDTAGYYLAEVELVSATLGKLISPKKLRIEIIQDSK